LPRLERATRDHLAILYVHDYPRSWREHRMIPDRLVTMAEQMVQDAQSAQLTTIGAMLLFCEPSIVKRVVLRLPSKHHRVLPGR